MATAQEAIEPLLLGLVKVPAIQEGICHVCHTATKPGYDDCFTCSSQHVHVLPISMSVHLGLLHHHLRNYKDGLPTSIRPALTLRLAALLETFLGGHMGCIGGPFDLVATVPSRNRDAPWAIVRRLKRFGGMINPLVYGTAGLEVRTEVGGTSILLIDDTFTTGRSIFAATRVLEAEGAHVTAIVLGRHVRPNWSPSATMLEQLDTQPWDFAECGICGGAVLNLGDDHSSLF